MINTATSKMMFDSILPAQSRDNSSSTKSSGAFAEALSGARSVRKQSESQSSPVRVNDRAKSRNDFARDVSTKSQNSSSTKQVKDSSEANAPQRVKDAPKAERSERTDRSDRSERDSAGEVEGRDESKPREAASSSTVVVAGAPAVQADTELEVAVVVPTLPNTAASTVSDAVDAAMRIAIDGEAKPLTGSANPATSAQTTPVATAPIAEAETTDAELALTNGSDVDGAAEATAKPLVTTANAQTGETDESAEAVLPKASSNTANNTTNAKPDTASATTATATTSEDVELGDVQASPTRSTASTPSTQSGPKVDAQPIVAATTESVDSETATVASTASTSPTKPTQDVQLGMGQGEKDTATKPVAEAANRPAAQPVNTLVEDAPLADDAVKLDTATVVKGAEVKAETVQAMQTVRSASVSADVSSEAGKAQTQTAAAIASAKPGASVDAASGQDSTINASVKDSSGGVVSNASSNADNAGQFAKQNSQGTPLEAEVADNAAARTPQAPNNNVSAQIQAAVQTAQNRAAVKTEIADESAENSASNRVSEVSNNTNNSSSLASQPVRTEAVNVANRLRESLLNTTQNLQERIDNIATQLSARLRLSQAAGGSQVQLNLKPRELGDVTVQMQVRDGVVAATVLVDKPDTLRVMQNQVDDLKRSLEQQGLSIDQLNVDVRGDSNSGSASLLKAMADARANDGGRSNANGGSGSAGEGDGSELDVPSVNPDELHDGEVSVLA